MLQLSRLPIYETICKISLAEQDAADSASDRRWYTLTKAIDSLLDDEEKNQENQQLLQDLISERHVLIESFFEGKKLSLNSFFHSNLICN